MDHVIGVFAGKGGVGKSTVAVNLALLWAKQGKRVGVLDADIYGPSVKKMLGEEEPLREKEGKMIPARAKNIDYVSAAFFHTHAAGAVVRAPVANQMIAQFLEAVAWEGIDYLIIDFPPGTGDVHMTLLQHVRLTGALAVTTPQAVAVLDVEKSIHMITAFEVPLLGIVENMSYFVAKTGDKAAIFGEGGGARLAQSLGVPLLGQIPLDPLISRCGDCGTSLFDTQGVSRRTFEALGDEIEKKLGALGEQQEKCLENFELIWNKDAAASAT